MIDKDFAWKLVEKRSKIIRPYYKALQEREILNKKILKMRKELEALDSYLINAEK